MLSKLQFYMNVVTAILLALALIDQNVIGQTDIDPVGPGVCNNLVSRMDTVVTSTMQSRIVPYNGDCSWLHHNAGCVVYKVTFQPVYRRTTKLIYDTEFTCCHGWTRVGQKCERVHISVSDPPQGPLGPEVPRYPFQPGLGGRGQRKTPGIGQRGFGPGAFKPRPGFGPPKATPSESPGNGRGPGGGPQFNPRPGFRPGTDGGFGPRTETGVGGGGPSVGTDPGYGFRVTQIPEYPGRPHYPQGPQGPQYGGPPLTPNPPGSRGHNGVNAGRGQPNNAGPGNGVKPGVNPGRFPDRAKGQGPAEEDKNGSGHLNTKTSGGSTSVVTIMGALLGVFGIFGAGAILMMYLSRRRDSSGRGSVRLRRSSLRDAAGRDSAEAHKSWKFSIYQFRLQ